MSGKNGKLILDDARRLTPPVNPVEAMRRSLALAMFNNVKETDVSALVDKLKEMAMAGDLKAMDMFFKLTTGAGAKESPAASGDSAGLRMMADAIHGLVDEIRISKAPPPKSRNRLAHDEADED